MRRIRRPATTLASCACRRIAPVSMAAMLNGGVVSSFVANLPAVYLARNPGIRERGAVFQLLGRQADFFVILVVVALAAGVLLLGIAGRVPSGGRPGIAVWGLFHRDLVK